MFISLILGDTMYFTPILYTGNQHTNRWINRLKVTHSHSALAPEADSSRPLLFILNNI